MNISRDRSNLLSFNSSRKSLTCLNMSSILYMDKMETQNHCLTWAEQIDSLQNYQLSYTTSNKEKNYNQDKAIRLNNSPQPCSKNTNNNNIDTSYFHGLETSFISYEDNQPTNPNSWNDCTASIFIFRNSNSIPIPIDIKNIKISLYQIADFIKNKKLKNNMEKEIPSITGFRQSVWILLSSIYKVSWDVLKTNDYNLSFQ